LNNMIKICSYCKNVESFQHTGLCECGAPSSWVQYTKVGAEFGFNVTNLSPDPKIWAGCLVEAGQSYQVYAQDTRLFTDCPDLKRDLRSNHARIGDCE